MCTPDFLTGPKYTLHAALCRGKLENPFPRPGLSGLCGLTQPIWETLNMILMGRKVQQP